MFDELHSRNLATLQMGGFDGSSEFQTYEEEDSSLIGYGFEVCASTIVFLWTLINDTNFFGGCFFYS